MYVAQNVVRDGVEALLLPDVGESVQLSAFNVGLDRFRPAEHLEDEQALIGKSRSAPVEVADKLGPLFENAETEVERHDDVGALLGGDVEHIGLQQRQALAKTLGIWFDVVGPCPV